MPDPNPELIHNEGEAERSTYITFAEETAKLTLPTMSPRGHVINERPWTSRGTSAVRGLGSATLKILFPPGVQYGRVDLPPEAWRELQNKIEAGDEKVAELTAKLKIRLRNRTMDMMHSLRQKNVRSRAAAAILRNLVEGNTILNNTPEGMRVFPLRSITVQRNEFGEADFAVVLERLTPDVMSFQKSSDFKKGLDIYTLINWDKDEVWTQVKGEAAQRSDEEDPVHWWVVTPERPDVANYAVGYAYNYIRLIAQIDHAESSLAEAMAFASWNPVGIREGSVLSEQPNAAMERENGMPLIMQDGDIIWPDKDGKLRDWAFVQVMRNEDADELAQVFALGIKDRARGAETSATEVLEIVDEINSQTADLLSNYEDTFQRPLLRSENRILDTLDPLFTDEQEQVLADLLRIVVTTGVNALDKQRTMARFAMQVMPAVMAIDPRVQAEGMEILDRTGEGMLLETDGLYSQKSPEQMQAELIAASGGVTPNGEGPREETIMTNGGPQPPQPVQGPPPAPG